ncbi:MAG: type I DNA topoisomerase [Defluviitaleaceae bacterium]|nr:type I DNA topoisomerase [Defluviitaleaceae bacterium]MCL2263497.1 type I DNA topoisomerase [Defluviitaleaceae bacterium]MCL2263935.1 type I DNA topoisomerase [Defluviitaleaceae bacterium]
MSKNLVILESPSKAKTIRKILGSAYKIEACVGHVRDLPKSQFGVDIENDYEPKYITIRGKGDILATLRKQAKAAKKVYLATDPDREGEAISWHLMHALKLDEANTERITFNEITKTAVKKALKEARSIDMDLVDAQQARRILDRIVGYRISPLLWKKVKKGTSAGRVQSVVLKLVCDREEEIEQFIPEEYWTMELELETKIGKLTARYSAGDNDKVELKTEADIKELTAKLKKSEFSIKEIKQGTRKKKPPSPFTTSTLQQEASKLFGYATSKTMRVAQQLYEGVDIAGEGTVGLVSYIRTDSMRLSDEAYEDAVAHIKENYGGNYLPEERPQYKTKGRAQDAHEAIRPTSAARKPDEIKKSLTGEQYKLYKLIWERFLGSQMQAAVYDTLAVKISAINSKGEIVLRTGGSVLKFDGYLAVYSKNEDSEKDVSIPPLSENEKLSVKEYIPAQHFTQPPPRFSEGTMVRTMEELGIGRPGTFAQTITTLMNRGYITKESRVLYPTELGEIINDIMNEHFTDIVDADFTARMEGDLDLIELGEMEWKNIVRTFYPPLAEKIVEAEEKIGDIEVKDEVTDIICEHCERNMVIKFGRFGKFLACPGFPECRNAKPLFEDAGVACPLCGTDKEGKVVIKKSKKGRKYFGCDKYPDCDFISWNLPTGENCPECGEYLVEKGRKKRVIACSACAYAIEAPEREEQ